MSRPILLQNWLKMYFFNFFPFFSFFKGMYPFMNCSHRQRLKLKIFEKDCLFLKMPSNVQKLLPICYHRKSYHQPFIRFPSIRTRSIRNYLEEGLGDLVSHLLPICAREEMGNFSILCTWGQPMLQYKFYFLFWPSKCYKRLTSAHFFSLRHQFSLLTHWFWR